MARDFNIVTFHRAYNYGAVLQAYALQEFLKQRGYSAGVYDYISYGENRPRGIKARLLRFLLQFDRRSIKKKQKKYEDFVQSRLELNLEEDSLAYVSGSDQVWNPAGTMEDAYYLRFASENAKKVSYAASMGDGTVPEERREKWEAYIRDFDHLSVREAACKERLAGFCDREIAQHIDPTLLHDMHFWKKVGKRVEGVPEKYILVYLMHFPKNVNRLLKWLREKTEAKIVLVDGQGIVQGALSNFVKHDLALHDIGPEEFVWLFSNARGVVTSSFHGTAFSLIFHKEVYAISSNPSSRISDILEKCGIASVKEEDTQFLRNDSVYWDRVAEVLQAERLKSQRYFEKIASEMKG